MSHRSTHTSGRLNFAAHQTASATAMHTTRIHRPHTGGSQGRPSVVVASKLLYLLDSPDVDARP